MYAENSSNITPTNNEARERDFNTLPELIPIAILVTLTNGLVFLLFYKRQSLRKAANYLLLSLAICDFLNGSLNIILFLLVYIPVVPKYGTTYFPLICTAQVSHNFVAITEAFHILLITAEKYMALMRPLRYRVIKTRTMLLAITGAWLISGLIAASPIFWFADKLSNRKIALLLEFIFNVFCLVVVFIVPYALMLSAYVTMFRKVVKKRKPKSGRVFRKKGNELKCLVIFATMASVFALCWLPWFVLRLFYSIAHLEWMKPNYNLVKNAAKIITITKYLASAINPLLYTFFKQDFWKEIKRTFFTKWKEGSKRETDSRHKRLSTKTTRSDFQTTRRN
ncbi:tachykinin-like peptides receptor 86C [Acropora millepora]|uniref:tachykinin-like peptides receptor 86C n=1 Tax=Acropora millepora TaxID=45264 RepID=UPI001CF2F761|nr:tachykinin-like peptides receptor 86C [Acropora millepora]